LSVSGGEGQALLLWRNGTANVLDRAVGFFQHEAQRVVYAINIQLS